MRILGAEFIDLYNNHWPGDDWYHDDETIDVVDVNTGDVLLKPDEQYDTDSLGGIYRNGGQCSTLGA